MINPSLLGLGNEFWAPVTLRTNCEGCVIRSSIDSSTLISCQCTHRVPERQNGPSIRNFEEFWRQILFPHTQINSSNCGARTKIPHTHDGRPFKLRCSHQRKHTHKELHERGWFKFRTKGTWCAHTHIKRTTADDDSVSDPLIKRCDERASSQRRLRTNSSPNPRNAPRTIASNGKPGIPMPDPPDVVCIDEVELVWTTSMMYPRTNRSCVAVPL